MLFRSGKGTRLKKLKNKNPKCLLKINKKTLLEYQIILAKKFKFKSIILLTGYKSSLINNFLKKKKLFANIKIIKDKKNLGNGSALMNAINYLDDEFFLIYCDILTKINLKKFYTFSKKKNSDLSLVVNKNSNFEDSNLVTLNKNQMINNFYFYPHKKFPKNCYSNEAIFICKKNKLLMIKKKFYEKEADFVKDIIPKLLKKIKIFGYKTSEYIIDCGTPERLEAAKKTFKINSNQK